jgi:hypothetical protein
MSILANTIVRRVFDRNNTANLTRLPRLPERRQQS